MTFTCFPLQPPAQQGHACRDLSSLSISMAVWKGGYPNSQSGSSFPISCGLSVLALTSNQPVATVSYQQLMPRLISYLAPAPTPTITHQEETQIGESPCPSCPLLPSLPSQSQPGNKLLTGTPPPVSVSFTGVPNSWSKLRVSVFLSSLSALGLTEIHMQATLFLTHLDSLWTPASLSSFLKPHSASSLS